MPLERTKQITKTDPYQAVVDWIGIKFRIIRMLMGHDQMTSPPKIDPLKPVTPVRKLLGLS